MWGKREVMRRGGEMSERGREERRRRREEERKLGLLTYLILIFLSSWILFSLR